MKALPVSITEEQLEWIKTASKSQKPKISMSEFVRAMIDYCKNYDPKTITARLAKARIEAEITEATKTVEQANETKMRLEKELAKIG